MSTDKRAGASWPYMKNLVGVEVDEESMKSCPYAKDELYWHVSLKTAQAGSILGALIGAGIGLVRKNTSLMASLVKGSRNGMLIGLPLGTPMVYFRMKELDKQKFDMEYAYYDRAYRLRHNKDQVRVDRTAISCFLVGSVYAAATTGGVGNLLAGGAVGLAAGTLLGGAYNASTKSK